MEEGGDAVTENDMETSAEDAARRERDDRRFAQRGWALDKSIEWCKHINDLVAHPGNGATGKIMTSSDVMTMGDFFYEWLHDRSI